MFESQENQGFALAFTSLSIILLAFFIFLSSLAVPQEEKKAQALRSLEEHFIPQKGIKNKSGESPKPASPSLEFITYFPNMSRAQRFSLLKKEAQKGGTNARFDEKKFVIFIPNNTLFVSNGHQIKAQSIAFLENIAKELLGSALSLKIEVHAETRTAETIATNSWQTAAARAMSLYRFFLDRRVPSTHITAEGHYPNLDYENNQMIDGEAKLSGVTLTLEVRPVEA